MDFSFSLSDDLYVISKGGRSVVEEEEDSDVIFVIVFAVVAWIGTRVERPRRRGEISRSPFPPASSFWHAAEIEHEMSVN